MCVCVCNACTKEQKPHCLGPHAMLQGSIVKYGSQKWTRSHVVSNPPNYLNKFLFLGPLHMHSP